MGVGCHLGLAIERERHGRDSGELRRLFKSLECKQDEYSKSMILHSITRCVYLLEAEVREASLPLGGTGACPADGGRGMPRVLGDGMG